MRVWASTPPLYFVEGFIVCVFAVHFLTPNKSLSLPVCSCLLCLRLPKAVMLSIFLPFNSLTGREKKPHQDGNTMRASPWGGGFLVHSA